MAKVPKNHRKQINLLFFLARKNYIYDAQTNLFSVCFIQLILQLKSFHNQIESEDKDDNESACRVWFFIVEIFYNFLCPLWCKDTNNALEDADPTNERNEKCPVKWPLIEEDYVTNTNHNSEKSWKYNHSFILYDF